MVGLGDGFGFLVANDNRTRRWHDASRCAEVLSHQGVLRGRRVAARRASVNAKPSSSRVAVQPDVTNPPDPSRFGDSFLAEVEWRSAHADGFGDHRLVGHYGERPEDAAQAESNASVINGRATVERRKASGPSGRAIGYAAGLTGQTLANLEVHGMMPRVDTVEMLARVLSVTAGWLGFVFVESIEIHEKMH